VLKRVYALVGSCRPFDMHLTDIEFASEHREWFAKTQLNHIFWLTPLTTLFCFLILMFVAGPAQSTSINVAFSGGLLTLGAFSLPLTRRIKKGHNIDYVRDLALYKQLAVLSGIVWGVMFGTATNAAGPIVSTPMLLLAAYWMFSSCIRYISIPHAGFLHILAVSLGTCAGLITLGTPTAFISAAILSTYAVTMFSVLYNLYYSFATRRLRTRVLRETNETVELLLKDFDEQGSDWLWEVDGRGHIVQPSARFCEAALRNSEELSELSILNLFDPGVARDELKEHIRSNQAFRDKTLTLTMGNETLWWSLSGRPNVSRSGDVIGIRGAATDISETKRAEAKIAHMAHYDELTDLPNRMLFYDTLKRALARRPADDYITVLYLDLDRFKTINDTMGHDVGDIVLKEVANRVLASIRAQDMVARFGGDEFAIMLTHIRKVEDAIRIAHAIIDAVAQPLIIDGQQIIPGTSVGLAMATDGDALPHNLLKYADLALYDAKERGGHDVSVFAPVMLEAIMDKRSIEVDLGAALSNNELELYYQPLINIETNQVVAYEALLRWNHSKRGQIQPDAFIPIAEETGVIVQIGEWVIRDALMEARNWPEHLSVSVNVSPTQMRSPNLLPTIISALASSGIMPERLELEITEGVLMNDSTANLALLHKIKSLGVRIALDDFGTGYSSLNYLRSFPFDKIKIDRCFVDGVADRHDCQAIIHAVISLAASLNMTTTAEGIEDPAQLAHLKTQGCNQAQGYLFSRPVRANQLEQAVREKESLDANALHSLVPARTPLKPNSRRAIH